MILYKTREEWDMWRKSMDGRTSSLERAAFEDITTLFTELDSLRAQLAEALAKADDWQAMKDERDAAKNGYANLLDDTNGEIKGLRAQLAEQREIASELAESMDDILPKEVRPRAANSWLDHAHVRFEVPTDEYRRGVAALARFHATEGKK